MSNEKQRKGCVTGRTTLHANVTENILFKSRQFSAKLPLPVATDEIYGVVVYNGADRSISWKSLSANQNLNVLTGLGLCREWHEYFDP